MTPSVTVKVKYPAAWLREHAPVWDWKGERTNTLAGFPITVNDAVSAGELHVRDTNGESVCKIINIGELGQ